MNAPVQLRPLGQTTAWTPRQLDTIKQTVAPDTNDSEFDLFIEYARAKRLDPFLRQVIAIVFSKDKPDKRKMTILTPQDGLRVLAARCKDYRPAEDEPTFTYDEKLIGPTNPFGLVKCTTRLWKQDTKSDKWHPVNGFAYWSEFAPIKTSDEAFEWKDTGDFWEDSGKPKKRKVMRTGADLAKLQTLDDSGQWAKMGRVMLGKCATCVALRAGWPEEMSGTYGEEEMARPILNDLTASEMVESEQTARRAKMIGMAADEVPFVDHEGTLLYVAAGQYADHVLRTARNSENLAEFMSMKIRNRNGLQHFWASRKSDALELKAEMEKIELSLPTLNSAT